MTALPGLTAAGAPTSDGALVASAERTIAALEDANLLTDRHALSVQLVRSLARAVEAGLSWGKVSVATATLAKQLQDAIAALPMPDDEPAGDAWTEFQEALAAAAPMVADR